MRRSRSGALFVGIAVLGSIVGSLIGASLTGRTAELGVGNLPLLWLNGALLFWAIGAIALLASVVIRPADAGRSG